MIKTVALSPHVHGILKQLLEKSCVANDTRTAEHTEVVSLLDSIATVVIANYGVERTPNLIRAVDIGALSGNVYSFSVYNAGNIDGEVLGGVIKPGETFNFNAGSVNNYFDVSIITFDGTGTELVIIYNT